MQIAYGLMAQLRKRLDGLPHLLVFFALVSLDLIHASGWCERGHTLTVVELCITIVHLWFVGCALRLDR